MAKAKENKNGKTSNGKNGKNAQNGAAKPATTAATAANVEAASENSKQMQEKYEEVKRRELHITELQRMTISELRKLARKSKVENVTGLKKQDLIQSMMKRRTMEIIKEREQTALKKKQQKIEIALNDETGSNQWRLNSW